jgi:hypothetical protein
MINPVSASHVAAQAGYGVQQATSKPSQPAPQQSSMPEDKVTISSSGGDIDHDGDGK